MNLSKQSNVRVVTLGCRLNTHESDVMAELAQKENLSNVIIVNTCAVTAEATRQAKQTIRRLRRDNPEAYLIATGCAVQLQPDVFSQMPQLDRILGNPVKLNPESFSKDFAYRTAVGPFSKNPQMDWPIISSFSGKAKAFLQVQNGCNHRCSFCTIPMGRGPSRSAPLGLLVQQAHQMLDQGIQEIVLTGVDLTSYGADLPIPMTLGQMIRRFLGQLPNLKRLRLSSLDSIEIDPDLTDLIVSNPYIMPHLHLSFQSGSDPILKAMGRRHRRQHSIDFCQFVRQHRPEIALGADFIVGFPGETEEMFSETMHLVDECGLTHLHVFPFSPRPGTVAATLPNRLDSQIVKKRARTLLFYGESKLNAFLKAQIGQDCTVLTQDRNRGCTDQFCSVIFDSDVSPHQLVKARILGITKKSLKVAFLETLK